DVGKDLATRDRLPVLAPQRVNVDPPLLPDPHLANSEASIDLELVKPAMCPDHFGRDVGSLGVMCADDVAFVGLGTPLHLLFLERPGAVAVQIDARLLGPALEQASDDRLDPLVVPRWAHQLELAFEVGDSNTRALSTDLEDALVLFP